MNVVTPDVELKVLPGERFSVFRSNTLPDGVSFAFYAPDGSLRPLFKKGALVLCDDQQLRPGDIGLFEWKGDTLCRQYHKDPFGITYLFALDRKRRREDVVVPASQESDLRCYGRVRMDKRIPLPGM